MRRRPVSLPKIAFLLTALTLLFVASSSFGSVRYTVRKGDTLSRIARKFKVRVRDIQRENEVAAKKMKPGMKLDIPVRETAARKGRGHHRSEAAKAHAAVKPGSEEATKATDKGQAPEEVHHVVRKGETLRSIARKYSVSVAELKELNGLKSSKVKKGRKLLVRRTGPKTYMVRRGDNIWRIAKKFDMDADDLMEMNEMTTPDIKVGQRLFLEEKIDTARAEAYKEKISKLEEDIKATSASEDFAKEDPKDKVITFAKKLLNIPYKFGGNSILGIDCSAYVKKVYGLLGIQLPRTAREQFNAGGDPIDKDQLSIGDLVFFRTYASFPSHVGIYLGNNLFIHASSKGRKVTIDSLETPYYLKRFIGGKRLLTEEDKGEDRKD